MRSNGGISTIVATRQPTDKMQAKKEGPPLAVTALCELSVQHWITDQRGEPEERRPEGGRQRRRDRHHDRHGPERQPA